MHPLGLHVQVELFRKVIAVKYKEKECDRITLKLFFAYVQENIGNSYDGIRCQFGGPNDVYIYMYQSIRSSLKTNSNQ